MVTLEREICNAEGWIECKDKEENKSCVAEGYLSCKDKEHQKLITQHGSIDQLNETECKAQGFIDCKERSLLSKSSKRKLVYNYNRICSLDEFKIKCEKDNMLEKY